MDSHEDVRSAQIADARQCSSRRRSHTFIRCASLAERGVHDSVRMMGSDARTSVRIMIVGGSWMDREMLDVH